MKSRRVLVFLSLLGLLTSCGCSDTPPEIDFITPFLSMKENVTSKYEGPLTITSRTSGVSGSETYDYHLKASYDGASYRYYNDSELNNATMLYVPDTDNPKMGMFYYKSTNTYKTQDTYSRQAKKNPYLNIQTELFNYLELVDSLDLLKEFEEYYSYMYSLSLIQGEELVFDPLTFTYSFVATGDIYKFSCSISRWSYVTSKDVRPNCLYQSSISITYDKDYLYSLENMMSITANYDNGTSFTYTYNRSFSYSLEFDENGYNKFKSDFLEEEFPVGQSIYNTVSFSAYDSYMSIDTLSIGGQVDFTSKKAEIEERLQVTVEGFYLDKELTKEVTSLISDEYQIDLYMKLSVKSGYYLFVRESLTETVTLPGDYISPELYNKLYYEENLYRYVSLDTYLFGEEAEFNLSSTENSQKIVSVTVDNEAFDTSSISFSSGDIHYYKRVTRKYDYNKGYDIDTALPISVADSINTSNGIYLRNFSGSSCWYKVNTSEILKSNFELSFKDYSSEHLLTSSNISSLTELDKSGVTVTFNINGKTVTSIPEEYTGDIYFQTYYEGPSKLHYLLIG